MTPELKAKWCEALRSGKYFQTSGSLEKRGSYCCLGVLEVIEMGSVEHSIDGCPFAFPTGAYLKRVDLPIMLANALAKFNDQGGTFEEIADKIELEL